MFGFQVPAICRDFTKSICAFAKSKLSYTRCRLTKKILSNFPLGMYLGHFIIMLFWLLTLEIFFQFFSPCKCLPIVSPWPSSFCFILKPALPWRTLRLSKTTQSPSWSLLESRIRLIKPYIKPDMLGVFLILFEFEGDWFCLYLLKETLPKNIFGKNHTMAPLN